MPKTEVRSTSNVIQLDKSFQIIAILWLWPSNLATKFLLSIITTLSRICISDKNSSLDTHFYIEDTFEVTSCLVAQVWWPCQSTAMRLHTNFNSLQILAPSGDTIFNGFLLLTKSITMSVTYQQEHSLQETRTCNDWS